MKLIVEKQGENVKAIKAEYTPTEALVINHAMRRYACDEEINAIDRAIMERMLDVKPIRQEMCEDTISRAEAIDILEDFEFDNENGKNSFAKARERMCDLPSVQPKPIERLCTSCGNKDCQTKFNRQPIDSCTEYMPKSVLSMEG